MLQTFRFHAFFIVLLLLVSCSVDSSEDSTEIEEVKNKLNEILPKEIELLSVQETDITGFFEVNFEFKNAMLQSIIGLVFNDAMQRIVRAFERRASDLYNKL